MTSTYEIDDLAGVPVITAESDVRDLISAADFCIEHRNEGLGNHPSVLAIRDAIKARLTHDSSVRNTPLTMHISAILQGVNAGTNGSLIKWFDSILK